MSTLRVTGLKQETSTATNISLAVGGGVTVAGISTFYSGLDSDARLTIGGTNVTDSNLLTLNGSGATQNVGIVLNKTNSPAKAYGMQVNNSTGDLLLFDYSESAERMRVGTAGSVHIGPGGAAAQGHGLLTLTQSASAAFNALVVQQGNTGFNLTDGLHIGIDGGVNAYFKLYENRDIYFTTGTSNTEKLRIDSNGAISIGSGTEGSSASNLVEMYVGATDEAYATIRGKYNRSNEFNRSEVRFGVEDNANGLGFLAFATGNNSTDEQFRIDSSGRLLAGTTSFTGEASLVLQASNAGATTQAQLWLNRGSTPTTDNVLGQIIFGDNTASGRSGAMIQCRADDSWAADDYPSRLMFLTTANGGASPTERLRISSDGRITHGPVITKNWTDSGAGNGVTETLNLMAFNTTNNNRIYGEITVWCCRSGLAQQRGYVKYAIGMSYYGGSYAGFINELERTGVAGFSTLVIERDGDNIRLRHAGNTAATGASMTIQFVGSIGGSVSFY